MSALLERWGNHVVEWGGNTHTHAHTQGNNGQTEKPVPSPIKHTTEPSNPGQQSEANGQNHVPSILPSEKDPGNQRSGDLWALQVLWTAKRKRNGSEIPGI